ncbi:hypothetical protein CAC42_2063 [Sphaceloma murrayae]|uniref:Uncharacterized protein n=1 Tax=Sphaceloma murrayae TaxID=2082308 RepID=A0A2K1QI44_9PEZI|nr:hypothetical protein CAC42_2063 [Sphaceloma murrayae]
MQNVSRSLRPLVLPPRTSGALALDRHYGITTPHRYYHAPQTVAQHSADALPYPGKSTPAAILRRQRTAQRSPEPNPFEQDTPQPKNHPPSSRRPRKPSSSAATSRDLHNTAPNPRAVPWNSSITSLNFNYLPPPLPAITPVTPAQTRNCAYDPKHPLNIYAHRRIEEWKHNAFNWTVTVPVSVSKKAVVRNWVKRRMQAAIREALECTGKNVRGEVAQGTVERNAGQARGAGGWRGGNAWASQRFVDADLHGALLVVADKTLVTASAQVVKQKIEAMLDRVRSRQGVVRQNDRHGVVRQKVKKGYSALR